jgi:hypothetical protein
MRVREGPAGKKPGLEEESQACFKDKEEIKFLYSPRPFQIIARKTKKYCD